jgi:hypothetical protein
MLRFSRGVQFIHCFSGRVDSSVESKRYFRSADVIINRPGNADDQRAFLETADGHRKGSIAAQNGQSIHFDSLYAFDDFIRDASCCFPAIADRFACIRIPAIRHAKEGGATSRHGSVHSARARRHRPSGYLSAS